MLGNYALLIGGVWFVNLVNFMDGIDYRDRFRGALLGSAVGEAAQAVALHMRQ